MLYASFFRPVGIYDGWFNRAAAWMTGGPYCHSELVFKWTKSELEEVMQSVKGHLPLRKKFASERQKREPFTNKCAKHAYP